MEKISIHFLIVVILGFIYGSLLTVLKNIDLLSAFGIGFVLGSVVLPMIFVGIILVIPTLIIWKIKKKVWGGFIPLLWIAFILIAVSNFVAYL